MSKFFGFFFTAGLVGAWFEVSILGGFITLMPGHSWREGTARIAGRLFVDWSFFLAPAERRGFTFRLHRKAVS